MVSKDGYRHGRLHLVSVSDCGLSRVWCFGDWPQRKSARAQRTTVARIAWLRAYRAANRRSSSGAAARATQITSGRSPSSSSRPFHASNQCQTATERMHVGSKYNDPRHDLFDLCFWGPPKRQPGPYWRRCDLLRWLVGVWQTSRNKEQTGNSQLLCVCLSWNDTAVHAC